MHIINTQLSTTLLVLSLMLPLGCSKGITVIAIEEETVDDESNAQEEQGEEARRQAYEKRLIARENQPEPELNPEDPREKFELVWRLGKTRLDSIYAERAQMLAMLNRMKIEDKKDQTMLRTMGKKLQEFGLGKSAETLEKAPDEICAIIQEVRIPADDMIARGEEKLKVIKAETEALDAKADAGGTVYQQTWDKIEKERKLWSAPVRAGKQLLLVLRSVLDEAYIVADTGPRRTQIKLRSCLEEIAKNPLKLDLAQAVLEKTIKRSRWYRDLR